MIKDKMEWLSELLLQFRSATAEVLFLVGVKIRINAGDSPNPGY